MQDQFKYYVHNCNLFIGCTYVYSHGDKCVVWFIFQLYIETRLDISYSRILKPMLQIALLFLSTLCSVSRIQDHKHHLHDVIFGSILGIAVAVAVVRIFIWYLSPTRAAKVQASLRIRSASPEPSLLAHTSSESRGAFRQKARSLAPLNVWACAVTICHDGMLEDTNSLDGAYL